MLIAGCGDVGRRVAAQYLGRGVAVTGLVSSSGSAALLTTDGVTPWRADLDAVVHMPFDVEDGVLFYFAPPPGNGDSDPRLKRFLAAVNGRPRKLVYISTSGVYGDCGGAWIDETAPVSPCTPRAHRRAAAEQAVREWSERCGVAACILRVPGIYGRGRLPVERLRRGLPILRAEDSPYTNRIHADDLATAAIAAMERGVPGAVYNISDGNPTTMGDYFNRVADLLALPRPPEVSLAEARASLTPEMMSFLEESRRLVTRRMREELGVTPRYPDLARGLPACLPA